jgi:hypothetical protein
MTRSIIHYGGPAILLVWIVPSFSQAQTTESALIGRYNQAVGYVNDGHYAEARALLRAYPSRRGKGRENGQAGALLG